jgi:hypothetical protein
MLWCGECGTLSPLQRLASGPGLQRGLARCVLFGISMLSENRCSERSVRQGESTSSSQKPSRLSLPFSMRLLMRCCFNQLVNIAHPSRTTDASSTSYWSHFPKGMKTFAFMKEQHLHLHCFTDACLHKRTCDWVASTSTFIQKRTQIFKLLASRVSVVLLVGSEMDPTPGQLSTRVGGFLVRHT